MSKKLTAREFIPKNASGKYSRNEVETYAEEYAIVQTEELTKWKKITVELDDKRIDRISKQEKEIESLRDEYAKAKLFVNKVEKIIGEVKVHEILKAINRELIKK